MASAGSRELSRGGPPSPRRFCADWGRRAKQLAAEPLKPKVKRFQTKMEKPRGRPRAERRDAGQKEVSTRKTCKRFGAKRQKNNV